MTKPFQENETGFKRVMRKRKLREKCTEGSQLGGKKASNVGSASLDFSLHHVMQSAFLIPQRPSGQFSAMLPLSFQGIAYVNMADKIPSAIKQLMCLKLTVVVYCL